MLKIKVKAGSITTLTDARYFAAREVEWLGFPIGEEEGKIGPLQVKAIAEWVDGVKIVGEFGFATADEIRSMSEMIGLDAVQVGMFISPHEVSQLKGLTIIKEVVVSSELSPTALEEHLAAYAAHCDFFLLNFSAAGHSWKEVGTGHPYQIGFLKKICQRHPIILSLDCPAEETGQMLSAINPFALSLSGGLEERVGLKSFDELDQVLDLLEID
jgi:phosphoribosylanthranilate isomerase